MKRLKLRLFLVLCLCCFLQSFSYAQEIEEAKAVLIRNFPSLSGKGAIIRGPLTIEEIEKKSLRDIAKCETCPQVAFGHQNALWERFKALYRQGDFIFYFRTDNQTWATLCGRAGYVLIRGKAIINTMLTMLN